MRVLSQRNETNEEKYLCKEVLYYIIYYKKIYYIKKVKHLNAMINNNYYIS